MSERTRDGLEAARARGPHGGQKPKLTARQAKIAQAMYDEVGPDGRRAHTVQQIADEFGVTRPGQCLGAGRGHRLVPMFNAWLRIPVRAAAIVTCRSARRVAPPEAAVNASMNRGCQLMTSRISSPMSTLGQHGLTASAEVGEARRVRDAVEAPGVDAALGVDGHPVGVTHSGGDLLPGVVQRPSMAIQQLGRVGRELEGVEDRPSGRLPRRAGQQAGSRVGPAGRSGSEDVAAGEALMELLEDAEHVRGTMERAVRPVGGAGPAAATSPPGPPPTPPC